MFLRSICGTGSRRDVPHAADPKHPPLTGWWSVVVLTISCKFFHCSDRTFDEVSGLSGGRSGALVFVAAKLTPAANPRLAA